MFLLFFTIPGSFWKEYQRRSQIGSFLFSHPRILFTWLVFHMCSVILVLHTYGIIFYTKRTCMLWENELGLTDYKRSVIMSLTSGKPKWAKIYCSTCNIQNFIYYFITFRIKLCFFLHTYVCQLHNFKYDIFSFLLFWIISWDPVKWGK